MYTAALPSRPPPPPLGAFPCIGWRGAMDLLPGESEKARSLSGMDESESIQGVSTATRMLHP